MEEQMALWDIGEEFKHLKPEESTDWKWTMANDYPKKNGLKVFSCFACGGGSTMGYKLVGCDVIGCCEIDKRMNDVYVKNHNPKYNYLMDIRDFNKLKDLPQELYDLDVLDGSPPCSTFSMAGDRADAWGKKKKFREGQKEQTLDDLPFVFIDTINKLRPKTAIIENVEGLLMGKAWDYVKNIYSKLNSIGYTVRHYLLMAENMGIPQTRHRVFFICVRNDIPFDFDKINMNFNYNKVLFKQIKDGEGEEPAPKTKELLLNASEKDKCLADVLLRTEGRMSRFNEMIVWDDDICPTIHNHGSYRGNDKTKFSCMDFINVATFPQDYKYDGKVSNIAYLVGMSVPPVMIKRLMTRLIESGLFDYKLK